MQPEIRESGSNDLSPFNRFLSSEMDLPSKPGAVPSPFGLAPRFLETDTLPTFELDEHGVLYDAEKILSLENAKRLLLPTVS